MPFSVLAPETKRHKLQRKDLYSQVKYPGFKMKSIVHQGASGLLIELEATSDAVCPQCLNPCKKRKTPE